MLGLPGAALGPGCRYRCGAAVAHPRCSGPRFAPSGPLRVVAAKPTKAADFRPLSEEDLQTAVRESERALLTLRIAQKTRKVGGWQPDAQTVPSAARLSAN